MVTGVMKKKSTGVKERGKRDYYFFFKWAYPLHIDVPRPEIESKLPLPPMSQL